MRSHLVLVLSLVLGASAASPARAQVSGSLLVLVTGTGEPSARHALRRWTRALAGALPLGTQLRDLGPTDCIPEDAACARQYVAGTSVTRILLVRVLWERAGCVPTPGGGHRMLRRRTLDLMLLDTNGGVLGRESRDPDATAADRRTAAAALVHGLGVTP